MKITIETIPHDQQRYPTVGDWQFDENGDLNIKVSELGDDNFNFLVAIHEMVEAVLCDNHGISDPDVTQFDLDFEILRAAGEVTGEPGNDPEAPYHYQHRFAELIERLIAHEFGVNWDNYSEVVDTK